MSNSPFLNCLQDLSNILSFKTRNDMREQEENPLSRIEEDYKRFPLELPSFECGCELNDEEDMKALEDEDDSERFSQEMYDGIEDYLDSMGLFVCLPNVCFGLNKLPFCSFKKMPSFNCLDSKLSPNDRTTTCETDLSDYCIPSLLARRRLSMNTNNALNNTMPTPLANVGSRKLQIKVSRSE